MRFIVLSLAATVVVLAAAPVQAAPVPNTRYANSHETPAQNVRKSHQYSSAPTRASARLE